MKVNDYVRTENGIDKVAGYRHEPEYENGHVVWFKKSDSGCRFTDKDLPKSSPNIIDLIEENDFVQMQDRGNRFYEIEKDYTGKLSLRDIGWDEYEELDETNIPEIVSIITHEQMEQIKYKVGE